MSSFNEPQSLQPLPPEIICKDSSAPEIIALNIPSPVCEDRSASNASKASEDLKMRTCIPGELSAKMNTETSVEALDSTIQKKATELTKEPSDASSNTTNITSTTTLPSETVPGREPLQKSGDLIVDDAKKQNLSRTGEQSGSAQEVTSTTASSLRRERSDSASLMGEHIKETSKGAALQQYSTTSSHESIKKEPVFLETGPLSSLCFVTQVEQCSKKQKADEPQLKSKDPQVSLATDVNTKRDQSAEVPGATVNLGQGISKSSLDSATTSGSGSFILGVCKSASDPPGGSDTLTITSKQKTKLTEITKMCSQEAKQTIPHPCPSTMHSDLSQDTTYDLAATSSNDANQEGHENKDPGTLSKSCSPGINHPQHNVGTQAGSRVDYKSVAVSPIVPPGGSSSFTFHVHVGKRAPSSPKGSPKGPPGKKVARTVHTISKIGSYELVPPQQEVGTQAGIRADCKSVANSPIVPPDGSPSFSFQTDKANLWSTAANEQVVGEEPRAGHTLSKTCSSERTPPQQEVGTQAGTRAECKSVAVSPFILPVGSSSFPFQEIKEKQECTSLKSSSCEDHTRGTGLRTLDAFPKTSSFELMPPKQDFGSQADTRVECKSVAVSPIVFPSDGSSFTFQSEKDTQQPVQSLSCKDQVRGIETRTMDTPPKSCSFVLAPPEQNTMAQADTRVEFKSVALSPIIPPDGDSSFTYQENKVLQSSISSMTTMKEQAKAEVTRMVETFTKTYSFELTPPQEDEGTPLGIRAESKSVAVSPIIPPDGSSSFSFHTDKESQVCSSQKGFLKGQVGSEKAMTEDTFTKMCSSRVTSLQQDDGTNIDKRVEYKSVAVSPIIVYDGSTAFTFQAEKKKQGSPSSEKPLKIDPTTDMKCHIAGVLSKTCLFELAGEQQDVGTQADTRVECKSVAISPIIPPDGCSSFTFQAGKVNQLSPKSSSKQTSPIGTLSKTTSIDSSSLQQDISTQADTRVECKSAAVSPIILPGETSSFSFSTDGLHPGHSPQKNSYVDQCRERDSRNVDTLSKGISFEITPPQQDVGVQVDTLVHCVHMAVSPIIPPDGSQPFSFQSVVGDQGSPSISAKPGQTLSMRDAEMQVYISVETRSIATGPMTPVGKSPRTSYPEVHVKGAKAEQTEPVREVSWDEKGMTWEVYGASMEVEVLGMAIQKHLEKQIEEHGRQKVMTPQNTRASSIRGAPAKGDAKRPPSIFRALLHNMRRPRCCSRAGPAAE
ncbi:G protein-regulated inducer of neurite outgrowth 1 [Lissotriton helveticus]